MTRPDKTIQSQLLVFKCQNGIHRFLLGTTNEKPQIEARAGIAIPFYQDAYFTPFNTFRVDRSSAMQVPAVARARNIIAGTIGTLGLNSYNMVTGAKVEGRKILEQPDPALPLAVTIFWTVEDLLLHGRSFWMVLEVNPEDGRPTQARRIDPTRVTFTTDLNTQEIVNGSTSRAVYALQLVLDR